MPENSRLVASRRDLRSLPWPGTALRAKCAVPCSLFNSATRRPPIDPCSLKNLLRSNQRRDSKTFSLPRRTEPTHRAHAYASMSDLISHLVARAEQRHEPSSPDALYGYVPSISLAAVFITIFGLTTLIHLAQLVISRRYWWMTCMVIAGLRECMDLTAGEKSRCGRTLEI